TGYRNLSKLVSRAFLESPAGERPHIDFGWLTGHTDGLLALTGGPAGAVGRLLAEGQAEAAGDMLQRLAALFPGALYVELMRHGDPVEDRIEGPLIDLAYRHNLPLVATNDCHFSDPDMYEAHDALLCIADGAHLGDANRRRLTPQHGFRSAAEMRSLFADIPEAVDNTLVVARRCAFMPEERAPILPAFPTEDGRTETEQLRAAAEAGLERRLATLGLDEAAARPYRERLAFELDVIVKQIG